MLVADDHRAMLDTLVQMLARDFDVVAAVSDGLSVVDRAELLAPDLLPAVHSVLARDAFISPSVGR